MKWYHFLLAFLSGLFIANTIPHLVNGISGNAFPTPFASPPGKGLSSPMVNVLWALLNMLIGYFLFHRSKISVSRGGSRAILLVVFFIGFALISVMLSQAFATKMTG